jgi:hypothetical protein
MVSVETDISGLEMWLKLPVECLLCKCRPLSSNPSPTKKKEKKEGITEIDISLSFFLVQNNFSQIKMKMQNLKCLTTSKGCLLTHFDLYSTPVHSITAHPTWQEQ